MITELEFVPVPAPTLDRIRCNGYDDHGNPLVALTSGACTPLHCCLRLSREGEQIALITHRPSEPGDRYAEIGPVYIHLEAAACRKAA